jgi:Flp pilus assembly protein TadG
MKQTERQRERGTQLLEFAIVMPVAVLLFFVVTEGSLMVRTHQLINNAAREGSRLCAADGNAGVCTSTTSNTNPIVVQVKQYLTTAGTNIDTSNVTVQIESPVNVPYTSGGATVNMQTNIVRVTYPYTLKYLPAFSAGLISPTFNLRAKAQFRNLN